MYSSLNVFIDFAGPKQMLKYTLCFQKGCLYRLRSLGERQDMDITIDGFHSWMWKGKIFGYFTMSENFKLILKSNELLTKISKNIYIFVCYLYWACLNCNKIFYVLIMHRFGANCVGKQCLLSVNFLAAKIQFFLSLFSPSCGQWGGEGMERKNLIYLVEN